MFANHVLNAVANNGHHFLIKDYVGLIAKPSVTRDEHRPAFLFLGGNAHGHQTIQSIQDPLNAATSFQVDNGISLG